MNPEPADRTDILLREMHVEMAALRRNLVRMPEGQLGDRRTLLRLYEEQTKATGDIHSDLLMLDSRLLTMQCELMKARGEPEEFPS